MTVHVTSALKAQLKAVSPTAEATLIQKFTEWKAGPPDEHYWFSNDKLGDDGKLRHVHMLPRAKSPDRVKWDAIWAKTPWRPWTRRSDRYLLYADGGRHGHLLIAILEDPGAHLLWTHAHKKQLADFETVADNFDYNGTVP